MLKINLHVGLFSYTVRIQQNCTFCCRSCRLFPVADHVDYFLCANSTCVYSFILASGWLTTMEEGLTPTLIEALLSLIQTFYKGHKKAEYLSRVAFKILSASIL